MIWVKFQRDRIDAIALIAGRRPVIKNMPKVGVALRAKQFDTAHTMAVINPLGYFCGIQLTVKTRPAAAGMKLAVGAKQWVVTATAMIKTPSIVIAVAVTKGCLGTSFTGDTVLLGFEQALPCGWVFYNFFCHLSIIRLGLCIVRYPSGGVCLKQQRKI